MADVTLPLPDAPADTAVSILLVDDKRENLVALEGILNKPDYRLVTATSGPEALKLLLREDFAVILLDVMMPGMDGFELASLIKQRRRSRHVPIIFLTALAHDLSFIYHGYAVGAVDYLLKPLDPAVVQAKVAVFVELHRQKQQIARQAAMLIASERAKLQAEMAQAEAQAAQRRSQFLAEVSHRMSSSLDYETALAELAQVALGELCDWCIVDWLEADGSIRQITIAHQNPGCKALTSQLARELSTAEGAHTRVASVIRSGHPEVSPPHCGSEGVAQAIGAVNPDVVRRLGAEAYICMPLSARDRTLGAMTLISATPDRHFGPAELSVAVELGTRAGLAIDNARLYHEATAAVRVRDEFLSIASHELRTPLTALELQIESMLRRCRKGDDAQAVMEALLTKLKIAERQTHRLSGLINELLDVTRLTRGQLQPNWEMVDLTAVVRDVAERYREELQRADCKLHLKANGPIIGRWDRLRIEQVITNLLANAIKYGAGRPIRVKVEADGERACLTVRDHGIGIAPGDQTRIFTLFERAVSARSYGGLGLGLYITKQIVEAFSGSVSVHSRLGEGATFTVALPLHPSENTALPDTETPLPMAG